MSRCSLVAGIIVAVALAGNADAGVRGSSFSGSATNSSGDPFDIILNFAAAGNARSEVETFEGAPPQTYTGTYNEIDLVIISFWTGTFDGFPTFEASGI